MNLVLGGSFDPVHEGHRHLVRRLLELYSPKKLFLVPAGQNPLKKTKTSANGEHRLKMLELAMRDFDPRVEILDWEIRREGPSYTVDTLERLRKTVEGPIALVMGDEVHAVFSKWKDPERIEKLAKIIVIGREAGSEAVQIGPLPYSATALRKQLKGASSMPPGIQRSVWQYIKENRLYAVKE